MFVRFREIKRQDGSSRLEAALIEARRRGGRPRQEFVAVLGSIPWPEPSFDARIAFWETLHQRLSRLANRIGDTGKIMGAIHAQIPMPTQEELAEQQRGSAEDEIAEAERRAADWERGQESNARIIKGLEVAVEQAKNTPCKLSDARSKSKPLSGWPRWSG